MACAFWAQELQGGIKRAISLIDKLASEKEEGAQDLRQGLQNIVQQFRSASSKVWNVDDRSFDMKWASNVVVPLTGGSENTDKQSVGQASIAVANGSSLQSAFDPILNALLSAMGNPLVISRSKALRGLSSIINADPDVLSLVSGRGEHWLNA